jgi:hypothetical protein
LVTAFDRDRFVGLEELKKDQWPAR